MRGQPIPGKKLRGSHLCARAVTEKRKVPGANRSRTDSWGIANWQRLRASSLLDDPTLRFGKILWRIHVVKEHVC
jgi:hypothetical protein